MDDTLFRKRCLLISIGAAVWLLTALSFHFLVAGPRRDDFLKLGREIALIRGDYHLPRGRLLSSDGTPLAWSEKYFDLYWQGDTPPSPELDAELRSILGGDLSREIAADGSRLLRRDLSPVQLESLDKCVSRNPSLAIHSRLERVAVNLAGIRPKLGEVALENGRQIGVSGLEKEYDAILAGKPGRYEVMLDRYRNWIESTLVLTTPAEAGHDVKLDLKIGGE